MLVTNVPASGPANLELVTIQNNNPVGLSCSDAVSATGVLATDNTSINIATACRVTACSPAGPTCGAP